MKYLFTGGGTGGHVAPNLAIYEQLKKQDERAECLYVGVKGKAEASMAKKAGLPLSFVRSMGFPGSKNIFKLFNFMLQLSLGILKALIILLTFRPDAIIATGGYVAAPIIFAAKILRSYKLCRAKIFLHESNAVPGKMNAIAARFADIVGVCFHETLAHLPNEKGIHVGYPVRRNAVGIKREEARAALEIADDAKVIFAFGGSQGARTINRAIVDALPTLLEDEEVVVIHGTGKRLKGAGYDGAKDAKARLEEVQKANPSLTDEALKRYRSEDFFDDMGRYYAASDLVICRAGSGTLYEIAAQKKPSIIIPKANLPGDHQVANARNMERLCAARVYYETVDLTATDAVETADGEGLARLALTLLNDKETLAKMGENAAGLDDPELAGRIGKLITGLIKGEPIEMSAPKEAAIETKERVLGLTSGGLIEFLAHETPTSDERRLIEYKINGYLAMPDYISKARGAKLVGMAGYEAGLEALLMFATGKDAQGKYLRLPITRRDAFYGLGLLGVMDERVKQALHQGLKDPYFEAKTEAASAIAKLAPDNMSYFAKTPPLLYPLLNERIFEVRVAAIGAIGVIAEDADEVVRHFEKRYFDKVWKVRQAIFRAYQTLVERGCMKRGAAAEEMEKVLITSNGYSERFPLKVSFNQLRKTIGEPETKA